MRAGEPFPLRGPAGALEARLDHPPAAPRFRAVVAHPHPLYGGTMDNAVVELAASAVVDAGGEALRFNFRGVGQSDGQHDGGAGERLDLAAAAAALGARRPELPLVLAGYSFGAVATLEHLARGGDPAAATGVIGVLLLAPPVTHYEGAGWRLGSLRVMVIYGERDALTPPALLRERAARWGAAVRYRALPGAGHDLGALGAPNALQSALGSALTFLAPESAD
ncbi:MAG TPA: alpha/beta hydrolase [Thermoanaerobaculia bacterium]|nr:alpha/beta hydrolase [Thermoanaerobaculia bacterium]